MSETKEQVYTGMAPPGVAVVLRMVGTSEGILFINTSINGFSFTAKPGEMYEFALTIAYPALPSYGVPSTPHVQGVNVIINQPSAITNTYNLTVNKVKITDDV